MNGAPKKVASGKKGNVGGVSTPGRHGHMIKALTALVQPGPATKKKAAVSNMPRPEGNAKPSVGPHTKSTLSGAQVSAGAPKDKSAGSGHQGVMPGARPEGAISRDAASVLKP
jgi:hypothetical protein